MCEQTSQAQGFTLIELSIVLVIIGLIVGGIMVGQSLLSAAAVRAQISQIEKYQTATATFREKYGELPGDIQPTLVTQFGFTAGAGRSGMTGDGDGNGELDGTNCCLVYAWNQGSEVLYFWEDLSNNAHLIEGGFNAVNGPMSAATCTSVTACSVYFPYAKIGNGAFVYVYSGYATDSPVTTTTGNGPNFFGLAFITTITFGSVASSGTPALTVSQAYAIDSKIDDGRPTTGNILAQFLGNTTGGTGRPGWSSSSSTPSATTCYDTSSGTAQYSITYQKGALINCGISFRMLAGD